MLIIKMGKRDKIDNDNKLDTSKYKWIKVVAFDLYKTCAHSREWLFGGEKISTFKEIRKEVIKNLGKTLGKDSDKIITDIAKELRHKMQTEKINIDEPIKLSNWVEIKISKRTIKKFKYDVSWVSTYDDFLEAIKYLKEKWYKTAVVSNLGELYAVPLKNGIIPEWSFDYEVLSYQVWDRKPSPKIFEALHDKVGVEYNDIVFIGDNLKHDIEWSWKMWINPIHINRQNKKTLENKEIDWIEYIQISTLKQLKDIL